MESEAVEECAMESTSIYWIPIWRVLETAVRLHLVNPYFIKQLPGKKSDVKDAEWIATCMRSNLIASSFVPDEKIQRLRQYDRRIFDLNTEFIPTSLEILILLSDKTLESVKLRLIPFDGVSPS